MSDDCYSYCSSSISNKSSQTVCLANEGKCSYCELFYSKRQFNISRQVPGMSTKKMLFIDMNGNPVSKGLSLQTAFEKRFKKISNFESAKATNNKKKNKKLKSIRLSSFTAKFI